MSNKFSKILMLLVAVISVIGLALFINVSLAGEDPEPLNKAVGPLVAFSTYLLYAAIAVTVVLSVLTLVKNPENLKKTLFGLVALAVLLVISYVLGDSNAVVDAQGAVIEGGEEGAAGNQWVGSLIWLSTALVIIGSIFFVYDLIKGLVKS